MNATKLFFSATALAIITVFFTLKSKNVYSPPIITGSKNLLSKCELINLKGAVGPESIAFDINGDGPYTGVADGRIIKWNGHEQGWVDFAVTSSHRKECVHPFALHMEHICGRPLGLRFDTRTGDLYIADAYLGLQVVGPSGGLATRLVTEVEGQPLRFTNDLDIDEQDDVIYFTDTSTQFQRRQFVASVVSGDKTGRLMKYDKSTKAVTVLLRGLAFANGVSLSKDKSFVLVAETSTGRIVRYWLKGPHAGKHGTFADLTGYPDNIRRNSKGEFWVALHSKRSLLSKLVTSNSWLGKTALKLPVSIQQLHFMLVGWQAHATAIKLSEDGQVLEVLEDVESNTLKFISEVEEKNGKLWIGSVMVPFVGVYELS
ncbi:Protein STRICTOSIDINE SYNTHASE-LIKE 10 [Capsicum baccatum]|uniref:Protein STRICTOSIDINE SYNTHASE-LIKE 10 n=1 Tax=Capsicum baccatum TaxID=33114 RepID=A0A2G2VW75_CAPBA|nr:Protein STRICTOSIDINE SYNTHASE-LIKE 10 [Capsicum baccatum]